MADSDDQSTNLDYCVTCGDSGTLVCCDGCPRAFHLICCDPPFEDEHPPPPDESWFCAVCTSKREAVPKPPRSLFSTLVYDVSRHNATKYALPKDLQSYFEGVHANDEGLYVYDEGVQAKHRTRAAGPAAEAEADPLKIKDGKGNFVLCFNCGLSAAGKREIIKCDYCGLHWHLDCLDPPPANPPVKQPLDGRPRPLWRCPAHATNGKTQYGDVRSNHKIRRPRNAKVVDTMLNRGLRNYGNIEIENEPSDDEDESYADDGTIYRITESGIKLDFIERCKRIREDEEATLRKQHEDAARAERAEAEARFDFNMRSFLEQRTALSLLEMTQPSTQTNEEQSTNEQSPETLSNDRIQSLIHGLISEAPSEVVALLADDPPKRPIRGEGSTAGINGKAPVAPNGIKRPNLTASQRVGMHDRKALLMLRDMLSKKLEDMIEEEDTDGYLEATNGFV